MGRGREIEREDGGGGEAVKGEAGKWEGRGRAWRFRRGKFDC